MARVEAANAFRYASERRSGNYEIREVHCTVIKFASDFSAPCATGACGGNFPFSFLILPRRAVRPTPSEIGWTIEIRSFFYLVLVSQLRNVPLNAVGLLRVSLIRYICGGGVGRLIESVMNELSTANCSMCIDVYIDGNCRFNTLIGTFCLVNTLENPHRVHMFVRSMRTYESEVIESENVMR